jgi:hypothetical protein
LVTQLDFNTYFVGGAAGSAVKFSELGLLATDCNEAPVVDVVAASFDAGVTLHASEPTRKEWLRFVGLDLVAPVRVTLPKAMRLRSCGGCDGDCVPLSDGARLTPADELVFELDGISAEPADRWIQLRAAP